MSRQIYSVASKVTMNAQVSICPLFAVGTGGDPERVQNANLLMTIVAWLSLQAAIYARTAKSVWQINEQNNDALLNTKKTPTNRRGRLHLTQGNAQCQAMSISSRPSLALPKPARSFAIAASHSPYTLAVAHCARLHRVPCCSSPRQARHCD